MLGLSNVTAEVNTAVIGINQITKDSKLPQISISIVFNICFGILSPRNVFNKQHRNVFV